MKELPLIVADNEIQGGCVYPAWKVKDRSDQFPSPDIFISGNREGSSFLSL